MYSETFLFIRDFSLILLIAAFSSFICRKLKQPVVLGYIIAGVLLGPYTLPFIFIHSKGVIESLAQLGVIFLMFSLGLEFDLHKLFKVGLAAFIGAFIEISLMIWLGYEIGQWLHWTNMNSIFLGAILSISSTTIIVKALEELNIKHQKFAQLIFGILVVEDIFAIAMLALLSSIAITGSLEIKNILITATKLSTFLVVSLCIGILFIPRILNYLYKMNNKEMFLIFILALCLGFCWCVASLDYSIALGAFLVGVVVAESYHLDLIQEMTEPLKNLFSAIFFVSVGLLFDPSVLIKYIGPILVITLAVIIGKMISCGLGVFLTGQNGRTSLRVGLGLSQIGEFSFIIASLGLSLHVTSHFLYPIAVSVSVITTFFTPYLIRYSDNIAKIISWISPKFITHLFHLYTQKINHIQDRKKEIAFIKFIQRDISIIILNLFVVVAIFLSSTYFFNYYANKLISIFSEDTTIEKAIFWGGALILALPFLLFIYRRMRNISLFLSKSTLINEKETQKDRKIISELIPMITLMTVILLISALTVSILPSIKWLIIIGIIILILTALLYAWFLKFHSSLENAFLESMKKRDRRDIMDIQEGVLLNVRFLESPHCNYYSKDTQINLLVIHCISLPRGRYGGDEIIDLFMGRLDFSKNPDLNDLQDLKVSAHILIRRDGEIIQFVPFTKRAWHAGVSEFQGKENCNDFSIGIELEGTDDSAFEAIQYEKLIQVTKSIRKNYPHISPKNIVGHSDIAPTRKTDPGIKFDWKKYLSALS